VVWQAIAALVALLRLIEDDEHLVTAEQDIHTKPHVDVVGGHVG